MAGLRYENKYYISAAGEAMLLRRLAACMTDDAHVREDGAYHIRSLYFDDYRRSALSDKEEGVEKREKFRIRYYNLNPTYIVLESKQKLGKMTRKLSAPLSATAAAAMAQGQYHALCGADDPLLRRFYHQALLRRLRPRVVVDYERRPFLFRDVRVTIDRNLHSGLRRTDFLNPRLPTVPVFPAGRTILEVKYDDALPDVIRRALSVLPAQTSAISKFFLCQRFL
ncbi:MAG: polyphosphate polymerase domain-containing protein [Oscillospiraceae bacterium]|nr:polyphosphate polymerase domain-containing protein [Oscillospiraceae bacterium]